jgi:hypothetical protein
MALAEATFERHYSVDELAALWGMSDDFVRRLYLAWWSSSTIVRAVASIAHCASLSPLRSAYTHPSHARHNGADSAFRTRRLNV